MIVQDNKKQLFLDLLWFIVAIGFVGAIWYIREYDINHVVWVGTCEEFTMNCQKIMGSDKWECENEVWNMTESTIIPVSVNKNGQEVPIVQWG